MRLLAPPTQPLPLRNAAIGTGGFSGFSGIDTTTPGFGSSAGFTLIVRLARFFPGTPPAQPLAGTRVYDWNGSMSADVVLRSRADSSTTYNVEEFRYTIGVTITHHIEEVWHEDSGPGGTTYVRDSMSGTNARSITFTPPDTIPSPDLLSIPTVSGLSDSYVFPDVAYSPSTTYGDLAREAQKFKGYGEGSGGGHGIASGDIQLPAFQFYLDPEREYQLLIESTDGSTGTFIGTFTGFPVAVPVASNEGGTLMLDGGASVEHAKAEAHARAVENRYAVWLESAEEVPPEQEFSDGDTSLSYEWSVRGNVVGTGATLTYEVQDEDLQYIPTSATPGQSVHLSIIDTIPGGVPPEYYQSGVVVCLTVTDTYGGRNTSCLFVVATGGGRLVSLLADPSGLLLRNRTINESGAKILVSDLHNGSSWAEVNRTNLYRFASLARLEGEGIAYRVAQSQSSGVWEVQKSADKGATWTAMSQPFPDTYKAAELVGTPVRVLVAAALDGDGVVQVRNSFDGGTTWHNATSPSAIISKSLSLEAARDGSSRIFLSTNTFDAYTDTFGATWGSL